MPQYDYGYIKDLKELEALEVSLNEVSSWSYDIESTSLDPLKSEIVGIGFSWKRFQGRYLPLKEYKPILGLSEYWGDKQSEVIKMLDRVLSNDAVKAAHNGKFDNKNLFHEFKITVRNFTVDTILLMSTVKSGQKRYSLDALSALYTDLIGYKMMVEGQEIYKIPIPKLAEYNNKDTDLTFRLVEDNIDDLVKDDKLSNMFTGLLMPLSDLTMRMEYGGVKIDKDYAEVLHKELILDLEKLTTEIYAAVGMRFKINSSDQLSHVLFDILKLPIKKISKKTNKPSTKKEILKQLQEETKNPVLEKIMKYRSLAANKTTFVDSFVPIVKRKDNKEKPYSLDKNGFFHGNFKLWWTTTGRVSSGREEGMMDEKSLNMQNIPRGPRFRKLFIPDNEKSVWIGADYAQLELRLLAHLAKDKELLRAFEEDYDPHSLVSSTMMGLSYEEVLDGYRKGVEKYITIRFLSKNVGFGWVYGAADGKFANLFPGRSFEEKKKAEKEAKERYFDRFNRIIPYKNSVIEYARQNGFIRTISGRKIVIENINSEFEKPRGHAERQAVNAIIQSPASDLTCASALAFDSWINLTGKENFIRIVNLIHDAIETSADETVAEEAFWKKKEIMETARFGITTKLKADIKISDRWEGKDLTEKYTKKLETLIVDEVSDWEFHEEAIEVEDED